MSNFKYTEEEKELNKVLKYNQSLSQEMLSDSDTQSTRQKADENIVSAEELLRSLGYESALRSAKEKAENIRKISKLEHRPQMEEWNVLLQKANESVGEEVVLEDILSPDEISRVCAELDEINKEFSKKTSIVNKTDLIFLAVATALQVAKVLIFPYVAEKAGYGEKIDDKKRKDHNDPSIKKDHNEANKKFQKKHKNHEGEWSEILKRPVPYDTTIGSKDLGINMGGMYHRLPTLGHDPILGWLFGTADILTYVITMNNFISYRVEKGSRRITGEQVGIVELLEESYNVTTGDYLNLPAAIFAQAQHLKSDVNTKVGLPIPLLASFDKEFANKIYREGYDALCFSRDIKIVGTSYVVSLMIDMIISLVHGLFREEDVKKELYEVRTRKILLISNSIASTSTIINAAITKNPKKLDIGSLLLTVTHLFTDVRFMAKIKDEFIHAEIDKKLQKELEEIDRMFDTF